jgi:MoxR-like ATPase
MRLSKDPAMADSANPRDRLAQVSTWLGERVVGQDALMERLLMALVCGGHLLVEGAPGLAKTRAIKELASAVEGDFHRIQFTPDLLPSDITGSEIYRPADASFSFVPGPIFHNLILADEVNRAPAKVQSALLEAMAEHQVSIGRQTFRLPELFLVMATQNPIEQEGTYPLPEAQLDRFLLHAKVDYPSAEAEHRILDLVRRETLSPAARDAPPARLSAADVLEARARVLGLHMAASVQEYLVQLIVATRHPERYDAELGDLLEYGASPRGSIALDHLARAAAWFDGRAYVTPDDVRSVAHDALRHRIILSYEAEAAGIDADAVIDRLLDRVPVS